MEQSFQASAQSLLTTLGFIAFAVGALAVGWVVFRLKSDETWKKNYERVKAERDELEKENRKLLTRLERSDADCEKFEGRYFRELAKVEWYEKRHGPIPPDAL